MMCRKYTKFQVLHTFEWDLGSTEYMYVQKDLQTT